MALTRDFKETVRDRAQADPAFRAALLSEALDLLISGDVETGRALLRDYINATIGFQELGQKSGLPPKSLMRMFGPSGNPRADNLFAIIRLLQDETGVQIAVKAA
jgi:DNA-binding phage protein